MGISARAHRINLEGVHADTAKIMQSNPRKIAEIHVQFYFPKETTYTDQEKRLLQTAAETCPVYLSLHPDIKKVIVFNWSS